MAHVLSDLVRNLGRLAARDGLAHLTDGELLNRFAADRDALAFEALVRRHGAMVLGVCERVLGRAADADDAFQATFLVLVRHAHGVRAGESLAGWLYRVARHVSTSAGRRRVRDERRERIAARPEAVTDDAVDRSDWRAFLDREVERLPARYREAFVLCHLEGRAHEDAARELGCPLGTLHSRLARAKERLRARLAASGVLLPIILPSAASGRLVPETVAAAVESISGSAVATSPSAVALSVALSQGVWKPVLIKSKCVIASVLIVAGLGSGVAVLQQPIATANPNSTLTFVPTTRTPTDPTIEELKRENERLRREVTDLKTRLDAAEARERKAVEDAPTDAEILRSLPKVSGDVVRGDITIVKTKILDRLDPPRVFPKVGMARLRVQHWECTVYHVEATQTAGGELVRKPRAQVVYIDKDSLVPSPGVAK